ncbi:hypothetical protein PR048_013440 [Dryococelus australis]|uniref:Uncharacterized protein n=1 Tax=Dryococelus australis TaxID=614101 RepID=A0ABQ9HSG8_9NEOP|nr:hypothetical protein PR048_013440 [Dryococelus australis]
MKICSYSAHKCLTMFSCIKAAEKYLLQFNAFFQNTCKDLESKSRNRKTGNWRLHIVTTIQMMPLFPMQQVTHSVPSHHNFMYFSRNIRATQNLRNNSMIRDANHKNIFLDWLKHHNPFHISEDLVSISLVFRRQHGCHVILPLKRQGTVWTVRGRTFSDVIRRKARVIPLGLCH